MGLYKVKHLPDGYRTNKNGNALFKKIEKDFDNDRIATVSFEDISGINSSFINSAFIQLLKKYDFEFIKEHLKIINSTKQINKLIKSRFEFEMKSN